MSRGDSQPELGNQIKFPTNSRKPMQPLSQNRPFTAQSQGKPPIQVDFSQQPMFVVAPPKLKSIKEMPMQSYSQL